MAFDGRIVVLPNFTYKLRLEKLSQYRDINRRMVVAHADKRTQKVVDFFEEKINNESQDIYIRFKLIQSVSIHILFGECSK